MIHLLVDSTMKTSMSETFCLVFFRRSTTSSAGRQMTIFYAGQAHVFDNVQPNKVHLIFMLMILMKL